MTRKRFIKLMMSQGYDRNKANELAEYVQKNNITYQNGYKVASEIKRIADDMIPKLAEIMQPIIETVTRFVRACAEGVAAFATAYSNAMSESE